MSRSACRVVGLVVLAFLFSTLTSTVVRAQEPQSVALAKQLTAMLDSMKLDSVATKDPSSADTFVAALYFPGQLMVVSARYSVPVLLVAKVDRKEYKDVYIDLNSASIANTKVLVMDLGADGLHAKHEENKPFDTIEIAGKQWSFDGEWKAQKITEDEYTKAFNDAEGRYTKMLQALIAQLKKTS